MCVVLCDEKIFTPEAYGAVADGIIDDSVAVNLAIQEAAKCGGTVKFAKDKIYFIKSATFSRGDLISSYQGEKSAIVLQGANNVIVKGDNTTIRLGCAALYFSISNCKNITVDGFEFDLNPHAAFRGRLISVCHETVSAVIKTDYEIPLENGFYDYCDYKNGEKYDFAMPDDQFRNHLFLKRIEKNSNKNEYTVWFSLSVETRMALHIVERKHCDIIMPTPDIGHRSRSFLIHSSENIHISNCNFKESPQFIGAIKGNKGELYFENIKMCVEEDQTIPMVAWRDGYHCKDNRGAIHWKNCEIGRLYDDAFNISCICLIIDGQPEPNVLSLKNLEDEGRYYDVQIGDVLSVYNTFDGTVYCESVKVTDVIKQEDNELLVRIDASIPEVDKEKTRVMFDSLSSPNSTIENCRVTGTVRYRGPITVKDTAFEDILLLWIENEDHLEGPVPKNMLFENCSFKGVYPIEERYLKNFISFRTVKRYTGLAEYKIKNVRLINCNYDSDAIYVEEGNDVKFLDSLK